jgi:hypothetical protein
MTRSDINSLLHYLPLSLFAVADNGVAAAAVLSALRDAAGRGGVHAVEAPVAMAANSTLRFRLLLNFGTPPPCGRGLGWVGRAARRPARRGPGGGGGGGPGARGYVNSLLTGASRRVQVVGGGPDHPLPLPFGGGSWTHPPPTPS